jgi:hypothetical protein
MRIVQGGWGWLGLAAPYRVRSKMAVAVLYGKRAIAQPDKDNSRSPSGMTTKEQATATATATADPLRG